MADSLYFQRYETVAASQTAQVLGTNGAVGDRILRLVIIPATVAGGVVTLLDGSTSIAVYVGGATTALLEVKPITVELGMVSVSGPWKITTGANISVIAVGDFT
jgi:hypothetical protein